jgi:recombination protein RecA
MSELFDKLYKSIEKNVSGVHASVLADSDIATDRYWIKTPAFDLNRTLSGSLKKGIQSRNLVGVVGPEHSMKSSFMVLCMVEAQKQGKDVVIIDTEGGITSDFCERWGLDTSNVFYTYTPFVDEVKSILGQIRESGEKDMVIGLDSAGGLERKKQFKDAADGNPKADQGLLQKDIRGMLKLFLNICVAQNSIGIVCGHLYGKPSMGVPMPDQIGGGKAMKLFPSILIQLYKQSLYEFPNKKGKDRGKVIGSEIKAMTIKNRYYPPFQTATVKLNYTDGVQPHAGILNLGIEAGLIEKKGSWYSYGEERLGQGEANATETLKELDNIIDDLDEWLKDTGYSTVNEQIKEAEQLLEEENV